MCVMVVEPRTPNVRSRKGHFDCEPINFQRRLIIALVRFGVGRERASLKDRQRGRLL